MTKEKIRFLIGLMLVAVVSFIAFQWYVIKEAVMVKNDQFNLRVAEAVQSVVHRLEKDEIIFLLQHRIDTELKNNRLQQMTVVNRHKLPPVKRNKAVTSTLPKPDSIVVFAGSPAILPKNLTHADVLMPHFRAITDYQTQIIDDFFKIQQMGVGGIEDFMRARVEQDRNIELAYLFTNIFFKDDAGDALVTKEAKNFKSAIEDHDQSLLPSPTETVMVGVVSDEVTTNSKEELLRDVIRDIVYSKRPINERVNRFLLDSMLKKEFQQSGINLPYEFAVKRSQPNDLLFSTVQLSSKDWDGHAYKAALFPNQSSNEVNQLYVYFPGKDQFVFGTIISLLVGSGTMVLAVLAIFYIAISTIVKQKKLSEMKNDFINNMTHEFKTPISTIALAVDMAKDTPNASRFLNIIKEENHRLGDHVEKVLQTALIDKGEIKLKMAPVNIHDTIVRVLNSFAVTLEQKEGEVDFEFDANNEVVQGDEAHLYGVIRNLIDNAIKYSPEKIAIKIETSNVDRGIQIVINDQGLGMTKEQQEKIFDKFYRVSTGDRHDVKGFGLGLSYAKEMIVLHHGAIKVTSKLTEGSTFTVWFPQDTPF